MPASRFNAFTDYGIGIGLRIAHYEHILSKKPVVDWFGIISKNDMVDASRPAWRVLRALRSGATLEAAFADSAEPPERSAAILHEWFAGWMKFGWFTPFSNPTKSS